MSNYAIEVRLSDNGIINGRRGSGAPPTSSAGYQWVPVPMAVHKEIFAAPGTSFPGLSKEVAPRWKWINGQHVLQEDPRPLSRWVLGAQSTENGPVDLVVQKGAVGLPDVTVQVLDDQGNVDTTENRTVNPPLNDRRVRLEFTNGEASIPLNTSTARRIEIASNEVYRVENPVTITVADTEL